MSHSTTTLAEAVWVARHGERIDFVDRSWPKTAERPHDPYLTEKGMLQAQRLAQRLAGEEIAHIFASPFLRALQTACPVSEALDLPIKIECGLAEWLNAQWFSTAPTYPAAPEHASLFERVDQRYTAYIRPTYPETWEEFAARTARTTDLLVSRYPGNILLVGHGASLVGVVHGLLDSKPRVNTPLCGLVLLTRREADWSLALNGDTAHLNDHQNSHQHAWA